LVAEAEAEGQRLRGLGPALMDGTPVNRDVMTQMLAEWVDQQAPDHFTPKEDLPTNQPITPMDDADAWEDNEAT
jgi:hypothetical protein